MSATEDQINGLELSHTSDIVEIATGTARDATDTDWITATSQIDIDPATNGANGLDSGTLEADTIYAIYVIKNGTLVAGLMSTKTTAADPPVWPAPGVKFRRIGTITTNGSAKVQPFAQTGSGRERTYQYTAGLAALQVLSGGTNTTWTQVLLSPFVPTWSNATTVFMQPSIGAAELRRDGGVAPEIRSSTETSWGFYSRKGTDKLDYKCDAGATLNLYVAGFGESV